MINNNFLNILKNQINNRYTNIHYLERLIKILTFCIKNPEIKGVKHHILPKCKSWFPEFKKDKNNIVFVTSRMHFIIHYLMYKSFPKDSAMYTACWNMTHLNKSDIKINSKQYSKLRELHSQNMKNNNPAKKDGIMLRFKGDNNPAKRAEVREKISKANKGRIVSDEQKEKQSILMTGRYNNHHNPFYGKKHTTDTIDLLKNIAKNRSDDYYIKIAKKLASRPKLKCPHCNKLIDERNAKRWHFEKCKFKQ